MSGLLRKTVMLLFALAEGTFLCASGDSLKFGRRYEIELSSGMAYKHFMSGEYSYPYTNRYYDQIMPIPFKFRVLCLFSEKFGIGIGYDLKRMRLHETHQSGGMSTYTTSSETSQYLNSLLLYTDFLPIQKRKWGVGFTVGGGTFLSSDIYSSEHLSLWTINGGPTFKLLIAKDVRITINPSYSWYLGQIKNVYSPTPVEKRVTYANFTSLSVGISLRDAPKSSLKDSMRNISKEADLVKPLPIGLDSSKNHWGFILGIATPLLLAPKTVSLQEPYRYRFSLYQCRRSPAFYFGVTYHTKKRHTHVLEFSISTTKNANSRFSNMFTSPVDHVKEIVSDKVISYRYQHLLRPSSARNLKFYLSPGLEWNNKHLTIEGQDGFAMKEYLDTLTSRSNIILGQVSLGIKKISGPMFFDLGLTLNVAGYTSGTYYHGHWQQSSPSWPVYATHENTSYSKILLFDTIASDWFTINNIGLRIGYLF